MSERRRLCYIDQDDIPASAIEYTVNTLESNPFNVLYLPSLKPFDKNYIRIFSAGNYSSNIIEPSFITDSECSGTNTYDSRNLLTDPYTHDIRPDIKTNIGYGYGLYVNSSESDLRAYYVTGLFRFRGVYFSSFELMSELYYVRIKYSNLVILYDKIGISLNYPFYIDTEE